ncbi:hypothetical protein [Mammaliicoccus sciuri]|uniref:hypothetical protein n=1 Tax=Mammaliicoccus sciuri TaxID=1296 RepID=UPI000D1FAA65|nr:hypothetical protein [Mammaliicoccus sciuri]PTJ52501.1 hypothetical protein BU012_04715 [Mammaliicoccus sciuri]
MDNYQFVNNGRTLTLVLWRNGLGEKKIVCFNEQYMIAVLDSPLEDFDKPLEKMAIRIKKDVTLLKKRTSQSKVLKNVN